MKTRTKAAAIVLAALLVIPSVLCIAGLLRAPFSPFAANDSARAAALAASKGEYGGAMLRANGAAQSGDRTIVRFREEVGDEEILAAFEEAGVEYSLPADSGAKLFVVYAPQNHRFFTDHARLIKYSETDALRSALAVTDDPVRQQAFEQIGVYEAWDGVAASSEVTVAVLDTGVWRGHEEFEGVNLLPGYNAVTRTAGVNDDSSGHGTAVTGIIAAAAGNRKGSAGVAHGVTVLPVKVSSTRTAIYSSDLISGIRFAADAGADIINLSVGGYSYSYAEQEAVDYALSKGCIIIAASGNEGNRSLAGQKSYPASYKGVISVASSSASGGRSAFSQYNECVDVAAPGEGLSVPVWEDGVSGYKRDSGTSYSCALVSGIAALALSGPARGHRYCGAEFEAAIIDTCGASRSDELGHGVINAPKLLARSGLPLITGVVNGGRYSEKVTVGFNFGTASLDGEPISDGETVLANGKHTVAVRYGDITVGAVFRIDRDQLTCEYKEYAEHSCFEFTRGFALLNGFPYASGTPVTASGRHRFVLIDGDEIIERTVDIGFFFPEVYGVEDGAVYDAPVGIRIAGGRGALLDGAPAGSEIAVTENGKHTLSVFSLDGRRTREYVFEVAIPDSHRVYRADTAFPHAAVDEEYGYMVLYNGSARGAEIRLLASPDKTGYTLDCGRIISHAFDNGLLLLFGEDSVITVDRATAAEMPGTVPDAVSPEEEVSAFVLCGGTLYCFREGALYSFDYFGGGLTKLAETGFECCCAFPCEEKICALPFEGSRVFYIIDTLTYDTVAVDTGVPVYSESLLFEDGTVFAGDRAYDSENGELLREFDGSRTAAYAEGYVFCGARIYDMRSGETAGICPEPLYTAYFGKNTNVMFYENGRIDVVSDTGNGLASFGAAPLSGEEFTREERADEYRTTRFCSPDLRAVSAAAGKNRAFMISADSSALYAFGEDPGFESFTLRFAPRAVTVYNGRVCVCFRNVGGVFCAPEDDLSAGKYVMFPSLCTDAFFDGKRIVAVCGGEIYYADPVGGEPEESGILAVRAAPCGENLAVLYGGRIEILGPGGDAVFSGEAHGETLFGGEYAVCGELIYSPGGEAAGTLPNPGAISAGNGIAVTASGVYSLPGCEYIGDTLSARIEACAASETAVYTFGGGVATRCGWGDGDPLAGGTFVAEAEDGGVYTESVTPVTPRGKLFVDGEELPPNGSVTAHGRHVLVHPTPCGNYVSMSFTVVSRLTGIEFSEPARDVNIGEQITLRLNYLPYGAGSFPADYKIEPEGASVDGSGIVSAEKVGVYRVTAEVDAGYGVFTAECTVTVHDDLMVFPPESGLSVDRNSRMLRGVPPGIEPGYLVSLLQDGQNAIVLNASGEEAEYPVRTGDRIVLLNGEGGESDSLTVVIGGDVDCDGFITAHDLYITERILTGYDHGPYAAAAADISGDGYATNFDYSWLRNVLTGYFPGETGDPPANSFGTVTALAPTQAVPGGVLDLVICVNGCKYTRAFSGRIERTEGLEFISCESVGWECGAYDDGASTGIFACSPDGEAGMRPFLPLVHLRYRITAPAGKTVKLTCEKGFAVSFATGSRTVRFVEAIVQVSEPDHGDFSMEIVNAKGFSFTPGSAMFAVIPYDAALADLRMVLPRGSTASVEGAAVPLEDTGTMHVTVAGADGSAEYYTVHLRREPAPGFDLNCRLSRLEVEGFRLDPAFDPDVTEYAVKVPYGTESVNVYCVQQNKTATVNVGDTTIRGEKTVISVSVVSRDGEELVYRITVERLPPEEQKPQTNESNGNEEPPEPPRKRSWPAIALAAAAAAAAGAAAFAFYRRKKKKNNKIA